MVILLQTHQSVQMYLENIQQLYKHLHAWHCTRVSHKTVLHTDGKKTEN